MSLWYGGTVYLAAATLATLSLALFLGWTKSFATHIVPTSGITRGMLISAAPILAALTAYHTAMFAGSNAMPILGV